MNPKQKQTARRLATVSVYKEIGIVKELNDLDKKVEEVDSRVDSIAEEVDKRLTDISTVIEETKKMKGDDGYTPIKGIDYNDGVDGYTPIKGKDYFDGKPGTPGNSYILSPKDIEEIAGKIDVPIVEKVIEKTEVIRELPIVTNQVIKESSETTESLRKKLEPILKDLYARVNDRGNNYGGFIETQLKDSSGKVLSKDTSGAWIMPTSSSSGTISFITFTGPIDGYNTVFTASAIPTIIFTDMGVWKQNDLSGFSIDGLIVTLPIAPGSGKPDPANMGWITAI